MLYWTEYKGHNVYNTYKDYDQNIYTLDIETTSLFKLKGKQHNIIDYLQLTEKEKTNCTLYSTMYPTQFLCIHTKQCNRIHNIITRHLSMLFRCVL